VTRWPSPGEVAHRRGSLLREAQRLAEIIRGRVDAQCLAQKGMRSAAQKSNLAGKRKRK